jgi:hypothetical protein
MELYLRAGRPDASMQIVEGQREFMVRVTPTEEDHAEEIESTESPSPPDTSIQTSPAIEDERLLTLARRNTAARDREVTMGFETLAQAARQMGDHGRALSYLQINLDRLRDETARGATQKAIDALHQEIEQKDREAARQMVISKTLVQLGERL